MQEGTNKIKISVCIPTLNRANFIGQALDSVISQADDSIEIVIVDGASTDNTEEVVRTYQKKFSNLVYYRGEKNFGVNRDMARTIEFARGQYCWLLSDDDALQPGAIIRIQNEIKTGYEIYLCNITVCNLKMQPIKKRYWLKPEIEDSIFSLHKKEDFIDYCNKANSIGALFSYMSSIILLRENWIETGYHYDFDDTAYALASSLFSFTKKKCRLKYIRDQLVLWRNDNESFQFAGGPVKRFLLDFDGYSRLADKYFNDDSEIRRAFLEVMVREHPWYTIINVTSFIDDPRTWKDFRDKMFQFGYRPKMVAICYALGRYKKAVSLAVRVKRKIVKNRRIQTFIASLLGRR